MNSEESLKMIKRIIKIKNCPSFMDFKPSADLPEFAKYNLIYGWNGTGKTSFSRILRSFEAPINHFEHAERRPEFELELADGRCISHNDLSAFKDIRVFNKDFIDESVFGTGGPKPIFFLGKESKEDKERIDALQKDLLELQERLNSTKTTLNTARRTKDKKLSEEAKIIKEALTTTRHDHFRNYSRSSLEKSIGKYADQLLSDPEQFRLSAERLSELNRSIQQTSKATIGSVTVPNFELSEVEKQARELLSKTITSQVIDKLQRDQEVNKWAEQGLRIHKSKSLDVCAFCDQTIPLRRLDELENHFSDEYQRMIDSLRKLKDKCQSRRISISFPEASSFYDEFLGEYIQEKGRVQKRIELFHQKIGSIVSILEQKEQNPFSTPRLPETMAVELASFKRINEIIRKHNQRSNDFENQIDRDKEGLELHYIADFLPTLNELSKNIEELEKEHSDIRNMKEEKETELEQLRARLVSHYIPAQKINDDLEAFLGRSDIQLIAIEARQGYRISRNGEILKNPNLSEGEKTALAIVYFLAKINEEGFDLKNSVVVIDDPVSSLDSNGIFQAFSFIKESIKEAGQIFVLTHHFDFFRQVKNWFSHPPKPDKAEYFMTICSMETSIRNSSIVRMDNLLLDYESEYHFLFSALYKLSKKQERHLAEIYPIPNMARKFLESFLAFRVPVLYDKKPKEPQLYHRLRHLTDVDEKKKERIRRFVETHSHPRYEIGVQDFDMTLLGETSDVVNDLLDIVKEEDPKHYNFLVKSVTGQEPNN